jgi:hypothetical protein
MTTNHSILHSRTVPAYRKGEAEPFWRRACRQWEQSGLSQDQFCRRRGLSTWSLRWWRCELKRRDAHARKDERKPPVFLPVRVVEPAAPASAALEVVLRGGRIVRVRQDFDPNLLRKLIATLEEDGRRQC